MIGICIKTILSDLNRYIRTRANLNEDQVVYANYTDLATLARDTTTPYTNKIIMSLVDIVHQETSQNPSTYIKQGDHYIVKNLPINFYLSMLFAAHYEANQALVGLSQLARVIAFFHYKHSFNTKNTPGLPYELEGITATLINLDHEQKSTLWTCLDTTYMPSVIYKIGLISIEDTPEIWPAVAPINEIYKPH